MFSGKWNSRILSVLAASLKVPISSQMIVRQSYDEIPPKVEYSLSEKGRSIIPIFEMISKWGGEVLRR